MPVQENIAKVQAEIATACRASGRNPKDVRLIAVTKSQSPAILGELAAGGVLDFGENRIDHLTAMARSAPAQAHFHHIGRIQSRQIPDIVRLTACVHGLADLDHARRLARACAELGKRMPVFVQVNTSGEATKAGVTPDSLPAHLELVRSLPDLDLLGLMTMAPEIDEGVGVTVTVVRQTFAALRVLAQRHGLTRLSMGMSGDFALAIAEGATDVRIGSRLFQ